MIPIAKPIVEEEEKKAVLDVLTSGMLAQGPKVKELEENFAKFCGTKFAVALTSGTSALHTALYALGIQKGDEVITTPFTFVATANAILMQNANVVFADIKEDTFNIDPEEVNKKITLKTKAIIAVDLYGQPADYEKLQKIADKNNLFIIEDACQAVNAELNRKKAGSLGKIGVFSFYATKNMMSGEGGMLTTDDEEIYEKAKMFRHHGQSEKTNYQYVELGYNYRMTDIQAAIAIVQLNKIEKFTNKRIENAKKLSEGLKNVKDISLPFVRKNVKHVFHQYTIKVNKNISRDDLLKDLHKNGIGAAVFYPKPLHIYPAFQKLGYKEGDFPISERICKEVISLPIHPLVSEKDIEQILDFFRGIS